MEMLMFKPVHCQGIGHLFILYSEAVLQVLNILEPLPRFLVLLYFWNFLQTEHDCCWTHATAGHPSLLNIAQEHLRDKRKLLQACSLKCFYLWRERPLKDCCIPTLLCLTFPRFYFQKPKKGLLRASGQLIQHAQELLFPSCSIQLFRQLRERGTQRSVQLSKDVFLWLKVFQTNAGIFYHIVLDFPDHLRNIVKHLQPQPSFNIPITEIKFTLALTDDEAQRGKEHQL